MVYVHTSRAMNNQKENTICVGIIGAGRIGKRHAENIIRHIHQIRLKAIVDINLDSAWVNALSIAVSGDDVQSIFKDPTIDAVLICSPAPTHVPLIIEAAAAGKHIFCEKPLALDILAIQQALAAVEQAKVILQVGFNRRFDPNFAKVKRVVQEGGIGDPHIVHITSRDPEPPPRSYIVSSGGIFLDMSIHDFDMARFLVGSEITEVYATGAALIDPTLAQQGDVDTAVIQLTFANGALGVIDNSRQAVYGYDQRVEVFGSRGKMLAQNVSATQTELSTADAVTNEKPMHFFLDRYQASDLAELRSFCHCIRHDQPASVGGQDGLIPVIIGHAAKRSYQSHQPVRIDYEHPERLCDTPSANSSTFL